MSGEGYLYDDTAFLYFLLALSSSILFHQLYSLFFDLVHPLADKPWLKSALKFDFYKQKYGNLIQGRLNIKIFKKVIVIAILAIILFLIISTLQSGSKQLIQFDPYDLLQVQRGATKDQIKKSYKKLALKLHPDKNPGNPQAAAKFIQIRQAYKCFQNQSTMQMCQSYGNPDGQTTKKSIGIALPSVFNGKERKIQFLIIIFCILLGVSPIIFFIQTKKVLADRGFGLTDQDFQYIQNQLSMDKLDIPLVVRALVLCSKMNKLNVYQIGNLESIRQEMIKEQKLYKKHYQDLTEYEIKLFTLIMIRATGTQFALTDKMDEIIMIAINTLESIFKVIILQCTKYRSQKKQIYSIQTIQSMIQLRRSLIQYYFYQRYSFYQLDIPQADYQILKNLNYELPQLSQLYFKRQQRQKLYKIINCKQQIQVQLSKIPFLNIKMDIVFDINPQLPVPQPNSYQIGKSDVPKFKITITRSIPLDAAYSAKGNLLVQNKTYVLIDFRNNIIYFREVQFKQNQTQVVLFYNNKRVFPPGQIIIKARVYNGSYNGVDMMCGKKLFVNKNEIKRKVKVHPSDECLNDKSQDQLSSDQEQQEKQKQKQSKQQQQKKQKCQCCMMKQQKELKDKELNVQQDVQGQNSQKQNQQMRQQKEQKNKELNVQQDKQEQNSQQSDYTSSQDSQSSQD